MDGAGLDGVVLTIFGLVYLGLLLGGVPGLKLNRAGVALLGAIAVLATGRLTAAEAQAALDTPTLGVLFGLMIVSAQFRLGGFYTSVTRRLGQAALSPPALLGALLAVAGLLSALLVNDIVCLAMAPVLTAGCAQRGLRPLPFLLGLACASNVGSAATLIGNPQNILVGQALQLDFAAYLLDGAVPAALGLLLTWWVIVRSVGGKWHAPGEVAFEPSALTATDANRPSSTHSSRSVSAVASEAPPFDLWQTGKALAVLIAMVAAFLWAPWPRELVALTGAGLLLLSRRTESRIVLGLVDWQLLVLFAGLFVVNHALAASGALASGLAWLGAQGVQPGEPITLFGLSVVLSNLVSNVPAVMLLLPAAEGPQAGAILALASTLAGNLLLVGSIANLIVVDEAARYGVRIGWREHARIGVPVTLLTLAAAAGWLWLRAGAAA
ncbi:MAG: SLC13 family permease [Planctomycetota bacterium]